jgi:hypothetical protein
MLDLLRESGYRESPDRVTEEALRSYLERHPQVIESWVIESIDQRSSEGWFLLDPATANAGGLWVVGFHPSGQRTTFDNGALACAVFIKRYVQRLGNLADYAS